ncbi:MAG: CRISPR-associated endonuclease Cas1 [Thermomicrobiales bacterium]
MLKASESPACCEASSSRFRKRPPALSCAAWKSISTRHYFGLLDRWLSEPWTFDRRQRRPPRDPGQRPALADLHHLLHNSCFSALETVGLDPYFGVYHTRRYGRASLAVDLMEEFRPVIADAVVLELLNRRMLSPVNFETDENGAMVVDHEGWRQVARSWSRRLDTVARPPGIQRSISYQKILEYRARRLQRTITDGIPYEPFLIK